MAIAFPRGERTLGTRLHSLALSEPSQAFTMKALLRFCFILFVYLLVCYYNNYFWLGWWRGGGGVLGAIQGPPGTQTNAKMRTVSPLSLSPQ